jgi:hypothetical protein
MDVFVFIYLSGQVRATVAGRLRYDPAARVGRFKLFQAPPAWYGEICGGLAPASFSSGA